MQTKEIGSKEHTRGIKENYQHFTDKYFLRSKQILEAEGINPLVRYQVFTRASGVAQGLEEAVDFIKGLKGEKVKVLSLRDGESFEPKETQMLLEGRVQDLIDMETVYLGMISGGLTGELSFNEIRRNADEIITAAEGKPVTYFGARHFHYSLDEDIGEICKNAGFSGAATDAAAKAWGKEGTGTIPHALILSIDAYARARHHLLNPTSFTAMLFDKNVGKEVPRIVLVDTYNREVSDSIATANILEESLKGIRLDTCGENVMEGSVGEIIPELDTPEKYLRGTGVTIQGVWHVRKSLPKELEIVVSSGFNQEKIKAFIEADKTFSGLYGMPLFNSIGTGSVTKPVMATSDIVSYYDEEEEKWMPLSKVGRKYRENSRLEER